jgi:hypothetical protein
MSWRRLKQTYLGDDDDIEKYRPMKRHKVRIHELPDPDLAREDCATAALDAAMKSQPAEPGNETRRGLDLIEQQQDLYALAGAEAERNWLEAAEKALADNTSKFAVLPMNLVLNQWVYLSKLKAQGYVNEAPR